LGTFLQPEITLFNFDIDILHLEMTLEEDSIPHFVGMLKETELARLKYFAMDEVYVNDADYFEVKESALKIAVRAMTSLKDMQLVCDNTVDKGEEKKQLAVFSEEAAYAEGLPSNMTALPDVEEVHRDWKLLESSKVMAVYGWRS